MTTTEQIIFEIIAADIQARPAQVAAAVGLLDDGCTVPFVARYRKEVTGGLDDTQLRLLEERLGYLRELEKRREVILGSIRDQGKLTPELEAKIVAADTKQGLEDLYLPYRPKRRTLAAIAREAGLEPLALKLFENPGLDPETEAVAFVSPEKNVPDVKAALNGARDILAEKMSEDSVLLADMRAWLWNEGAMTSRVVEGMEETGAKFRDYFDYREPIARMPSHRALAAFRGQAEGVLTLGLEVDAERPDQPVERTTAYFNVGTQRRPADAWLWQCCRWTWRVKLRASLEAEVFDRLREAAEGAAIDVFGTNLRDLLLAAPAGHKRVLGLDPGIRTGVKTAAIDETGKLLATAVVFPFGSNERRSDAVATIARLIRQHRLTLVSIGNGTASRETVEFVEEVKRLHPGLDFTHVVVSEAGASVYSASELAAAEFPDLDVSYRGAVSIARRLQDPLAELVKIEPKAIGVGQYQHDVDQQKLAHRLDAVVEDCVNAVGVDVNTASSALLCRVAGLSPARANAIVSFRSANGAFRTRRDLLAVPRLGAKTFEQAAGFLRIPDGDDPLDASAVHPEAYPVVLRILKKTGLDIKALIGNAAVLRSLHARDFVDEHFGIPTVTDILGELLKPGRDPRPEFRTAKFADGIKEMKDLQPGMVLEGVVTNVAAFGAFVDVGVHQDGLVHISHLADRRVSDPRDVVKVGDIVKVRVLEVDLARQRISLSMRSEGARRQAPAARRDTRSAAPSQGAMAAAFAKLRR
ncbi:MAG: Tex family protein [Sutterella wadsworthensis]